MTIKKIFIAAISIAAIALVALYFIAFKQTQLPSSSGLKPSKKTYQIAEPKYGNFTKTMPVKAIYQNNADIGMTSLTKDAAEGLRNGQSIMLYDKEKNLLPLGGNIQMIRPNSDGVDILIKLPKGTDTDLLSPDIDIIKSETSSLKLLPLSALQKEQDARNENYFVWRVIYQENKVQEILKQPVKTPNQNADFFTFDAPPKTETFIILNPDDALKASNDNKNVPFNFERIEFKPPNYNPVYMAWLKFDRERLAQDQARMKQVSENCASGTNNLAPSQNGSDAATPQQASGCSVQPSSATLSAEKIFSNIQNMRQNTPAPEENTPNETCAETQSCAQ